MLQSLPMPSAYRSRIGMKLIADLLPSIVMNVAVFKNHAFIRILNRCNDYPTARRGRN